MKCILVDQKAESLAKKGEGGGEPTAQQKGLIHLCEASQRPTRTKDTYYLFSFIFSKVSHEDSPKPKMNIMKLKPQLNPTYKIDKLTHLRTLQIWEPTSSRYEAKVEPES